MDFASINAINVGPYAAALAQLPVLVSVEPVTLPSKPDAGGGTKAAAPQEPEGDRRKLQFCTPPPSPTRVQMRISGWASAGEAGHPSALLRLLVGKSRFNW